MNGKLPIPLKSRVSWQRQTNEPEEAYHAFMSYRNQIPPRDIKRVNIHNVLVPHSRVSAWSTAWDWAGRVASHDAHFDSVSLDERERVTLTTSKKMAERHAEMMHRSYEIVMRELQKLNAISEAAAGTPHLKPREVIQMMRYTVVLQRLIIDQSTANVDIKNRDSIDALDVDALEELDAIFKRAGVGVREDT